LVILTVTKKKQLKVDQSGVSDSEPEILRHTEAYVREPISDIVLYNYMSCNEERVGKQG
jgi:hypothetical protein